MRDAEIGNEIIVEALATAILNRNSINTKRLMIQGDGIISEEEMIYQALRRIKQRRLDIPSAALYDFFVDTAHILCEEVYLKKQQLPSQELLQFAKDELGLANYNNLMHSMIRGACGFTMRQNDVEQKMHAIALAKYVGCVNALDSLLSYIALARAENIQVLSTLLNALHESGDLVTVLDAPTSPLHHANIAAGQDRAEFAQYLLSFIHRRSLVPNDHRLFLNVADNTWTNEEMYSSGAGSGSRINHHRINYLKHYLNLFRDSGHEKEMYELLLSHIRNVPDVIRCDTERSTGGDAFAKFTLEILTDAVDAKYLTWEQICSHYGQDLATLRNRAFHAVAPKAVASMSTDIGISCSDNELNAMARFEVHQMYRCENRFSRVRITDQPVVARAALVMPLLAIDCIRNNLWPALVVMQNALPLQACRVAAAVISFDYHAPHKLSHDVFVRIMGFILPREAMRALGNCSMAQSSVLAYLTTDAEVRYVVSPFYEGKRHLVAMQLLAELNRTNILCCRTFYASAALEWEATVFTAPIQSAGITACIPTHIPVVASSTAPTHVEHRVQARIDSSWEARVSAPNLPRDFATQAGCKVM